MKIKSNYQPTEINNTTVIFPIGQNLVDNRGIIKVSGVGAFIVSNLQEDISTDELYERLVNEYEPDNDEERAMIRNDMNTFLDTLRARNILDETNPAEGLENLPVREFLIADSVLRLHAEPQYVDKAFDAFEVTTEDISDKLAIDVYIVRPNYRVYNYDTVSEFTGYNSDCARLMVGAPHVSIYEQFDYYYMFPINIHNVVCTVIHKYKPEAFIYLRDNTLETDENIFSMVKDAFYFYIHREGKMVVHSSSIIYNGEAWLFSAESGVGKSTHVELWRKNGFEFEDLNGDNIVVYVKGLNAVAAGVPWSGTSNIYTNKTVPLGGVFFISQAPDNIAKESYETNTIVNLVARCFGPNWTREQLLDKLNTAQVIARRINAFELGCNMELEAAKLSKQTIDSIQK